MRAPAAISSRRQELEEYLRTIVPIAPPEALYRMVRYHLGWEDTQGNRTAAAGKGLRPALCLMACEAVGGDWRRALPAAAAVELVHNFSLVHDDIQDRDTERHHRPTVWSVWGEAQAINAGDALLSLARLTVLRLRNEGIPTAAVLEAARILDERTLEMVEGQTMDLEFETTDAVDGSLYMDMIEKKTGALFDCSLALGAVAGGGEESLVEAMGRCGRLLGIAFQIRDDMLGMWGTPEQLGKPAGADILRKKKSLPIVHALSSIESATAEEIQRIYRQPEIGEQDVPRVLSALQAIGARDYCARMAQEQLDGALAILSTLRLSAVGAHELDEVATFLLEREF